MGDELLTAEEVADWLKIPVRTLHQWRWKRGGPPAAKVGRHLRYRKSAVEQWLNEQGAA